MHEQHRRMTEDLRFSNPADPKQWDETALQVRKGRPCLTFDRTNQFISQVVNDARQNKPSIHVMPVDSKADIEVAEKLNGSFRHIEYVSRAAAAYDMLIEQQARVGLGWLRVVPQIMRPETNEQEIRIMRVHDPKSVMLQAGWSTQDGSDAMHGFAETVYSKSQFKALYPKAKDQSWEGESDGGWFTEDNVRICEYFCVDEKKSNRIVATLNGQTSTYGEEDYHRNAKPAGAQLLSNFTHKDRKVSWIKMTGAEVLEETLFPSQYIPLVPGLGYEVWIDGKRYLCGMTRRMMDPQRHYNYMQSALTESLALQPKAPFIVPFEGVEGFEDDWKQLNSSNPAYLPYNSISSDNNPIPAPTRLAPPAFPVAFANAAQIASQDMEASLGMFKANLGQQGNETSGIAIRNREKQGDTANFHYVDNRDRAIERLAMVCLDMIPRVFDTQRQARIVEEDDSHDFVSIEPDMRQPSIKQGKRTVAINPSIGSYDVRVKSGPAFASLREEQADNLAQIMQAAPDLTPILADLWVGAQDWPEAEKAQKRLQMMLPPQIQQAESDDGQEIPPAAQAQMAALQQHIAQLEDALQGAHGQVVSLTQDAKAKGSVEQMRIQGEQQIKAAEFAFEKQKSATEANLQLAIQREKDASAERIARLNAEVQLILAQADAQQAAQAREADQVLEGQRITADLAKEQNKTDTQKQLAVHSAQQADKQAADQRAADEKAAAAKPPEPKAPDLTPHLEKLQKGLEEVRQHISKPKKSSISIKKQPDGSYAVDKVEA
jgi:hypothetical protein